MCKGRSITVSSRKHIYFTEAAQEIVLFLCSWKEDILSIDVHYNRHTFKIRPEIFLKLFIYDDYIQWVVQCKKCSSFYRVYNNIEKELHTHISEECVRGSQDLLP